MGSHQTFPFKLYSSTQGWALRSFTFWTYRSFPFIFWTKRSFPFIFRVFGDLWNPKERFVHFCSFLMNGNERSEGNVHFQWTEMNARTKHSFEKNGCPTLVVLRLRSSDTALKFINLNSNFLLKNCFLIKLCLTDVFTVTGGPWIKTEFNNSIPLFSLSF